MSGVIRLSPGATFAGDFRIVRSLAEGGMGAVYIATQLSTGAERALKVMLPQLVTDERMRARFEQEARVSSRIESDHIVQVVGSGVDPASGVPWIAMELLRGEDLATFMAKSGAQSMMFARELMAQLCHAIAAAHDVGVVHRDLKPENLLLAAARREGVPFTLKVLDFGIAKMAAEAKTKHTGVIGTPMWMAPEQTDSRSNVGAAADIWPLGLIAFHVLTGQLFWRGAYGESSVVSLIREIAIEPISPASSRAAELGAAGRLPPGFDNWFARCLARDPAHRFYSARDARSAFDKLGPVSASVPPALPKITASLPPSPTIAAAPLPQVLPPRASTEIALPAPATGGGRASPASSHTGLIVAIASAVVFALAVIAVGAGVMIGKLRKKPAPTVEAVVEEDEEAVHRRADAEATIPVNESDPVWGETYAPVTIVMFGDLECPYCKKVEENALTVVRSTYRDKVRIVWKDDVLPMHAHARPAALAANAVFRAKGSDAFWRFERTAYENQESLSSAELEKWAKELGVEGAAYEQKDTRKLDADAALVKRAGVTGTPSFRINCLVLDGAQSFDAFRTIIDEQIAAADVKRGGGTSRQRLYVELCRDNATKKPPKVEPPVDEATVWRVPVGASPVLGLADAPVTIVEFADFQCPYCKKAEPTLVKLRETYGDKVRLVWKNHPLPFHPRAQPAALFAIEARKQKGDKIFWATHDRLFGAKALEDGDFDAIAIDLGLDRGRVRSAVAERRWQKDVDADEALADDVEASGTPTFFVNGRKVTGAQSFEHFQSIVDDELRKHRQSSVPGAGYYEALIREGKVKDLERKIVAPPLPDAPFRGGAFAKVTIQEFADFQCPFCQRSESVLDEVLRTYGDRVKIVWRDLPLSMHADAALAAEAAREAKRQKGNAGFWAMHKKLFANQQRLGRADLDGYAREIGLDLAKFDTALDVRSHKLEVDLDAKAASAAQIGGTPGFVVNGYYLSGAQPFSKFRKVIDRALAE